MTTKLTLGLSILEIVLLSGHGFQLQKGQYLCASKDVDPKGGGFGGDPTSIEGRKVCQRRRWPRRGWIVMSHIVGEENKPPWCGNLLERKTNHHGAETLL